MYEVYELQMCLRFQVTISAKIIINLSTYIPQILKIKQQTENKV